jgi:hypothetical protein
LQVQDQLPTSYTHKIDAHYSSFAQNLSTSLECTTAPPVPPESEEHPPHSCYSPIDYEQYIEAKYRGASQQHWSQPETLRRYNEESGVIRVVYSDVPGWTEEVEDAEGDV